MAYESYFERCRPPADLDDEWMNLWHSHLRARVLVLEDGLYVMRGLEEIYTREESRNDRRALLLTAVGDQVN